DIRVDRWRVHDRRNVVYPAERQTGLHDFAREVPRKLRPQGRQSHNSQMSTSGVASHEHLAGWRAEVDAVAKQPGAALQHLQHDVLDPYGRREGVVEQRHGHTALDEWLGDKRVIALVQ